MKKEILRTSILLLGLAVYVPFASATFLSFDCITNNNSVSAAVGESQLSVEVTEMIDGKVLFTFYNVGTFACSITDVYFDNGSPTETLGGLYALIDSDNGGDSGVSFSPNATPPNLPGAANVSPVFATSAGLSADSDSPVSVNGVNTGETLGVVFSLISGKTFDSVLAAIASGDLRVGIHVQGFDGGFSEAFVNIPDPHNSMVPEPGTMSLLVAGLLSLVSMKKRRLA